MVHILERNLRLLTACLILIAVLSTLRAGPERDIQDSETPIKQTIDSLDLSEKQKQKVLAIFQDAAARKKAILEESGLTPDLSKRKKFKILRKIKPKLDAVGDEADRQLSDVLSPAEMESFKQVRADLKKELREKLKERKSSKS
ncbi:hypothetical protein [Pelagicoccus sp. SDUM812002]|uniref:hypothetical protein n=1 Tax=Pelagicoccus sp. SDUM812002 TaxID=3041266 RepID=UPI0028101E4E|nr:hypothetical protein [Pelagicoccus sp. SDUM812002]MDQ8185176.1 hypothetical protein [Pelagicoccus sp. SDUM812002]